MMREPGAAVGRNGAEDGGHEPPARRLSNDRGKDYFEQRALANPHE